MCKQRTGGAVGSAPDRGRWDLGKSSQKRHLDQAIKVDKDKWDLHRPGRGKKSLFQRGKVKMDSVFGGGTLSVVEASCVGV